jgi:hypothetical protein
VVLVGKGCAFAWGVHWLGISVSSSAWSCAEVESLFCPLSPRLSLSFLIIHRREHFAQTLVPTGSITISDLTVQSPGIDTDVSLSRAESPSLIAQFLPVLRTLKRTSYTDISGNNDHFAPFQLVKRPAIKDDAGSHSILAVRPNF